MNAGRTSESSGKLTVLQYTRITVHEFISVV